MYTVLQMFGLGEGTEYSLALTETDDISTGMFMVYGSQLYFGWIEIDYDMNIWIQEEFFTPLSKN